MPRGRRTKAEGTYCGLGLQIIFISTGFLLGIELGSGAISHAWKLSSSHDHEVENARRAIKIATGIAPRLPQVEPKPQSSAESLSGSSDGMMGSLPALSKGLSSSLMARADSRSSGWRLKQEIHAFQMLRQNLSTKVPPARRCAGWFQDNWEPSFHCPFKRRLGHFNLGGRWVCDPISLFVAPCLVYFVGSLMPWHPPEAGNPPTAGADWSFLTELHALAPHCEFHVFTSSVKGSIPTFVTLHNLKPKQLQSKFPVEDTTVAAHSLAGRRVNLLQVGIGTEQDPLGWQVVERFLTEFKLLRIESIGASFDCTYPSDHIAHEVFGRLASNDYVIYHKEPHLGGQAYEYNFVKLREIWDSSAQRTSPRIEIVQQYELQRFLPQFFPSKNPSSKAMADSMQFISDSDENWQRRKCTHKLQMRQWHKSHTQHPVPAFGFNFQPTFTCEYKERVGRPGDGGKWICDPYRIDELSREEKCLIYSIGSNGDSSFERAMHDRFQGKCEIHTFDPNPWSHYTKLAMPAFMNYHEYGLSSKEEIIEGAACESAAPAVVCAGKFKPLGSIMEELGHAGKVVEILKIDCEGCEWTTFQTWFPEGTFIRQLAVELHGFGLWPTNKIGEPLDSITDRFFKLAHDRGYVLHHKEVNTKGGVGTCSEFTLLRMASSFFESVDCSSSPAGT